MKPWLFAAGIETLITLLVLVALSALSSLLKRRQDRSGDLPAPPPIPRRGASAPGRPPSPSPTSWEEELRRLLEGEESQPAPPPVMEPRRAPAPPPLPRPAPEPVARRPVPASPAGEDEERGLAVEMPEFSASAAAHRRVDQLDERVGERLRLGSSFAAASTALEQARQLHRLAADRLRHVREQTPALVAVKPVERRSAEGARVAGLIRNPATVRSVFVASLVFGPAKGLES